MLSVIHMSTTQEKQGQQLLKLAMFQLQRQISLLKVDFQQYVILLQILVVYHCCFVSLLLGLLVYIF